VRFDVATGLYTDFAGARNQSGSTDGPLANARFFTPEDITADGNKLYVADGNNHTIRVIDLGSKMVSTLAGMAGVCGYADMPGTAAQFCAPHGVVADGKGNLYVSHNNSIRKIVIAGAVVSTVAGGPGSFGYKDATGAAAQFWGPNKLALDKAGKYLYLTEYGVDTVRRVELSSTIVSTVAGAPGRSQVVEGALPGGINQGAGIAFLPNGDLLVAVPRENSIVQIRLP
jgi:DNA-binding beta-propeller fold protein YncE